MPGKAEYEFQRELGQGSFGVVHLVSRRRDRKRCVIKQVQMKHFKTDKQRTQALNEAKIMKNLNCAHIVEYMDAFVENDCLFLVLQFCDNGDLKTFLKGNPSKLPDRRIWRIFIRLILGLEYLHSRRIIHRDMKSENVFLTGEDGAQIGDLGLAKMLTNTATGASTLCGTPRYLSPEEVTGAVRYSEKADVWALGVILYEMLSENHRGPFDEATRIPMLLQKIVNDEPQKIDLKVDANLREFQERCMDKKPATRPYIKELLDTPVIHQMGRTHDVAELQQFSSAGTGGTTLGIPSATQENTASVVTAGTRKTSMASGMGRANEHEVEDSFLAKLCYWVGLKEKETDLGRAFHRVGHCEICIAQNLESRFGIARMRHHCRNCGRSICARHSAGPRDLVNLGYTKPQRICEICNLMPLDGGHGASRRTLPLVIAFNHGSQAWAWDTSAVSVQCWRAGERLQWTGLGTIGPGGTEVYCTLENAPGAQLELRPLEYGETIQRVTLPGQEVSEDASGSHRPSAKGQAGSVGMVRMMKNKPEHKSPDHPKSRAASASRDNHSGVEFAACSGHWFVYVTRPSESKGGTMILRVVELPSGKLLGQAVLKQAITAVAIHSGVNGFVVTGDKEGVCRIMSVPGDGESCELVNSLSPTAREGEVPGRTKLDRDIVSIVVGGNANILCAGYKDKMVRLFKRDQKKGSCDFHINSNLDLCEDFAGTVASSISCSGSQMAFVHSKQLQSWEQGASLWNLGTGQWEKSFFKRGHSVSCVVLFDVLLATSATPGQGRGCTVQLWHAPTGTTLSTISNPAPVTALFVAEIVKVVQDETHRLSGGDPEREPLRDAA